MLHISEMTSERWIETSIVRFDGKREFRERPKYGNRHVVFMNNSEWGEIHEDEYNALDFPNGTADHFSKYAEEKTGIPGLIVKGAVIVGGLFLALKLFQKLEESL